MVQVLAEMAVLQTEKAVFLCYSAESTTVFEVKFDRSLWESLVTEAERLYLVDMPKRPTRKSQFAIQMKERLEDFTKTNVDFMGEFPSGALNREDKRSSKLAPIEPYTCGELRATLPNESNNLFDLLTISKSCLESAFELTSKKATEVLVWHLQDTDRQWHPERIHAVPIAYALKGYSLKAEQMRSMCRDVIKACVDKGLRVVCLSFDGQWLTLVHRDHDGKPLTLLQLQKDVYKIASKESKLAQLSFLKQISKPDDNLSIDNIYSVDMHGVSRRETTCGTSTKCFKIMEQINWERIGVMHGKKNRKDDQNTNNELNQSTTIDSNLEDLNLLPIDALDDLLQVNANDEDVQVLYKHHDENADDEDSNIQDVPDVDLNRG